MHTNLTVPVMMVIIVGLLLFILANKVSKTQSATKTACIHIDDEMRDRIRALMLQSADDGLKEQTRLVFGIWIRDDQDQPKRAIKGMQDGIRAYVRTRNAAVKWEPPKCE